MATSPSVPAARQGASEPPVRPNRRRQRSVRVTVAVTLLSVATAAVVGALPTQSPLWLSGAAVLSLVLGWAAARIVYSELVQSRVDNATDRAAQAQAYRRLFAERADEHAEFTTAMTDRLAARDRELAAREEEIAVRDSTIAALEDDVVAAQKRAIEAEARVQREARRADDTEAKLTELRGKVRELEVAHKEAVERAEKLAEWDGAEAVVDLMAWEQKLNEAVTAAQQAGRDRRHA
jgi:hypothetical protein